MYDIKVFFVRHKTFLINSTYIYMQQNLFCKDVFLFCATLTVSMSLLFSQHESSFGCHITFFVATTYFFVTRVILLRNVNFYVKHFFFVDTTVFCATQDFFVLPNVSIKNIVNKEKLRLRKSDSAMLFSTFWLDFLALKKSNTTI